MLRRPWNFAKNGHVLAPETISTTHRTEQEEWQNRTFKNVTSPRKVGLFAATIAAVKGSHLGDP